MGSLASIIANWCLLHICLWCWLHRLSFSRRLPTNNFIWHNLGLDSRQTSFLVFAESFGRCMIFLMTKEIKLKRKRVKRLLKESKVLVMRVKRISKVIFENCNNMKNKDVHEIIFFLFSIQLP